MTYPRPMEIEPMNPPDYYIPPRQSEPIIQPQMFQYNPFNQQPLLNPFNQQPFNQYNQQQFNPFNQCNQQPFNQQQQFNQYNQQPLFNQTNQTNNLFDNQPFRHFGH